MRIVFAGTPEFSVPALEALIDSQHDIIGVFTQPDRPAGRGRKLQASPVKRCAESSNIPLFQPASLKKPEARQPLVDLQPDLLIVVAYGLILPQAVLDVPRLGCWNIHASLLPRWRGAAPIHRAIQAGDSRTGVGIMQMDAGLDTGPVLLEKSLPIPPRATTGELHDALAELGAQALMEALDKHPDLTARAQPETGVTYAHKIDKSEAQLDFNTDTKTLDRSIRAFNPFPGAVFKLNGESVKVWRAEPVTDAQGIPGTILAGSAAGITVATADSAIRITEIQRPGSRRTSGGDYWNVLRARGLA